MSKLVLFDFDGTITTKDTLISFLKYTNGSVVVFMGLLLLSPVLVAYKLKLIPNWMAKQMVMRYFWMGRNITWMKEQGAIFCEQKLPGMLRTEAMEKIKWYQNENWRVVVVSASSDLWIARWAEIHGLQLIATRLEVEGEQLSGKIQGKNCYGQEKVNRIKNELKLSDFDEIHAYGDSRGDKEMLELAHQKFYKPFRN